MTLIETYPKCLLAKHGGAELFNSYISTLKATPGDTRDAEVNKLHCELEGVTSKSAVALLRLMNKRAKVFTANESARFISQSLVRKYLDADVLKKDFLYSLHQMNAVKVVMC